jgi:competence protein ComEA
VPDDVPLPLPPRPPAPAGGVTDRLCALRHDPRVAIVVLVALAVVAGVFWFRAGAAPASTTASAPPGRAPTTVPLVTTTTTTSTGAPAGPVVVHVAGAVAKPGVVTLRAGARVVDAIAAAGGANADADLDRLNLAAPLADGERIAVPVRGQPAPPLDATPATPSGVTAGEAGSGAAAATGPVNLNTATQADLEALPGIGPTLAAAIIAERDRSGGFRAVADLRRVRGIGDARFAQIEPLVTV